MMVSIIIPSYNAAAFLPASIESALNQTYPHLEIIVVNDGSKDNTEDVIKPYLPEIKYLQQENKGLSAARNEGYRASTGEFICFLDADDLLLPNKLLRQLEKFNQEPDLGVVISGYHDVERDGKTIIQTVRKNWNRDGLSRMLNHEVFPPNAALIRRNALEMSSLFPEDISTGESQEDWQLWLDMALNGIAFGSVEEPTCIYRRNVSSSISANLVKHNDGARRVVRWLKQDPRAANFQHEVSRLSDIIEMERVARAWAAGDLDEAQRTLVDSINISLPFWLDPYSYQHLFQRSLTINEQAVSNRSRSTRFFRQRITLEILPLAQGKIPPGIYRKVLAAAELACVNLACEWHDEGVNRSAVLSALKNSPGYALSGTALRSTLKGILGPSLVAVMNKYKLQ